MLILLIACCCKSTTDKMSKESETYIDEVLTLMEKNSVNQNIIDWKVFRRKVVKKAGGAESIADTYTAIHYAVTLLGDRHSYFKPVHEDPYEGNAPPVLEDESVPADIGYVRIRYCMGNDEQKQQYITNLIAGIKATDKETLKGWIIDLRGNFGGDMSPMLLGCAPLLGNTVAGYTIYPGRDSIPWIINNGKLYYNDIDESVDGKEPFYTLINPDPFIAVLTDTLTASSGEAIAIAFKKRPKTRSFGWKTYGVSTANQGYTLSDGSRLLLTVGTFSDRKMTRYGGPVIPMRLLVPKKHWIVRSGG